MKLTSLILQTICCLLLTFCGCDESRVTPVQDLPIMETDPFQQNLKLARSMNLGNMLEAPAEGEWGLNLQADYFPTIAAAGFTAVRLPVRWSIHADTAAPYTLEPVFLDRVNWAIDLALASHLAIVVDIHHYTEMLTQPQIELNRLLGIWGQLATNFRTRPDGLMLEVFNEPNDAFTSELWNAYLPLLIDTIRTIDASRTLIIGTAPWGGIDGLDDLVLPTDSNLIVTVHYYNPFQFTHQGAEWVSGSDAWLGTVWGVANADFLSMQEDFNRIKTWSTHYNRPIFIGEFGAYSRAEMASRQLWTRSVVQLCDNLEFSWAYWEFASGFGAYNVSSGTWNGLLGALIQD